MSNTTAPFSATGSLHEGLEGIVVAQTELSHVDGERGRLIIAGADVESLAGNVRFEEVCARLFRLSDPAAPVEETERALARGRVAAHARIASLGDALARENGMDALRAAVAHLPEGASREEVVAAVSVFAAAWSRTRRGLALIAPSETRGHAEDLLCMLGLPSDAARARALDSYLVTVIDHGLNASTFAARVVASTRSDLVSATVAGICALKGPLHGGAPGPVLDMLDAVGEPARASTWLSTELEAGRRIMGMGHRIYRVRDPRAFVLERAIEALEGSLSSEGRSEDARVHDKLALARAVEREAERLLEARHPGRALRANVEFYTAVLLDALGIDRASFTCMFAAARSAGWAAHYAEQRRRGRLIRPASRYVGPMPG